MTFDYIWRVKAHNKRGQRCAMISGKNCRFSCWWTTVKWQFEDGTEIVAPRSSAYREMPSQSTNAQMARLLKMTPVLKPPRLTQPVMVKGQENA